MLDATAGIGSAITAAINAAAHALTVPAAAHAALDICISCIGRTYNRRIPASFPSGSGR